MSFSDPPDPPDPGAGLAAGKETAAEQWKYNKDAGVMAQAGSMVNQYNPVGAIEYFQTGTGPGGIPLYSSKVSLSPEQQELYNVLMGTKRQAGIDAYQLLGKANYGTNSVQDEIGDMTSGLTKQVLDKQLEHLNPFFTTSREQLDAKLRNQGLIPGQPGYDNAMRALDTNQGNTVAKFLSEFQPQAYAQAMNTYKTPMEMAMAAAGFGAPGDPTAAKVSTPSLNLQPSNLTGAVANANDMLMKQYEAEMKNHEAEMSGMWGIPKAILGGWAGSPAGSSAISSGLSSIGSAMMMSDRRLKENIVELGHTANGLPVYGFNYIGDERPNVGLMADDVEKLDPGAVAMIGGYKAVNYDRALRARRKG